MKPELIKSLKSYKKEYIINDILSGLLVAIIALPLSIALGIQSGATLQNGILTAIIAGFFVAVLGGSRFQIGGPTAAFVVILLGYITNPEIGFAGLAVSTVLAGVILIILSFLKVGKLVEYLPYPIIIGFTAGIGITLLVGQLKDFCGMTLPAGTGGEFIEKITAYAKSLDTINPWTVLIGLLTLLLIIFIPRINKKIPAAFVSIIIVTLAVMLLDAVLDTGSGVATIGSAYGEIKAEFTIFDFSLLGSVKLSVLIVPAVVIAFLGAVESLLSATVADGMAGTVHDPNQELFGQGIANIASALFGGLPATGAIARTAANINSGAKSPLAGVFHSVFLLLMYLVLMPVVRFIPLASLAAVLMVVAVNMSNIPLFTKIAKVGKRDCIVLVLTCLLTVVKDLTYGVIGGFVLAVLINIPSFIKRAGLEKQLKEQDGIKTVTYTVNGCFFFQNAVRLCADMSKNADTAKIIIIDLTPLESIDVSAVEKLSACKKRLHAKNIGVEIICPEGIIKKRLEFKKA